MPMAGNISAEIPELPAGEAPRLAAAVELNFKIRHRGEFYCSPRTARIDLTLAPRRPLPADSFGFPGVFKGRRNTNEPATSRLLAAVETVIAT